MVNNGGEEISNKDLLELKKYEHIVTIWNRWDESYWTSFNYFLVINGLFFVALYTVLSKTFGSDYNFVLSVIFCIGGLASCLIWLFILNKKLTFIYLAEQLGRKIEEEKLYPSNSKIKGCFYGGHAYKTDKETYKDVYESITWFQKGFIKISSGLLTAFVLPFLFSVLWMFLLAYVVYSYNPKDIEVVNASIVITIIFVGVWITYFLIAFREREKKQTS